MPTSRNLVLCCDGTNNQFAADLTNVIRTYKVARRIDTQLTFYDPGVGTMPEPWRTFEIERRWSQISGLAFGTGFEENICEAYTFLMNNYQDGDKVYLFGFSRGAYTVRALAGMLHSVGLLYPGTENLIRYAQKYWEKDFRDPNLAAGSKAGKSSGHLLCEDFQKTLTRPCPIHFIGVWDTVGSVGMINQYRTFPYTMSNPDIKHIRHAVAIDERRCCFRQNLMFATPDAQDVKNVWFAGVHSDVGGGYAPEQAGLAKLAFEWMICEARKCGMDVDPAKWQHELSGAGAPPDPAAEQHESLKGGWRIVELIPQRRFNWDTKEHEWRMPLGARRNVARHAYKPEVLLHESVIERLKACKDYDPTNIPRNEPDLRALFGNKIEPRVPAAQCV